MDLVSKVKQRFGGTGKGGRYPLLIFIVIILAIIFVYTAVFTVPTGHQGIILQFGKYSRMVGEGLHFKIPFGVETVHKVFTAQVVTESFGFRTVRAGIRTQYEKTRAMERESLMLTGDLNVIDAEWIVQFRRDKPRKFLFNVQEPVKALRDISESVIRRIVGNWSFDYVLQNREEVNKLAQGELQKILDDYESGIRVVNVRLQKQIPKAKGTAERTINGARGYALERVNRAKGDVARFSAVLKEYRNAKEVTKRRLYLEAFQTILPNAQQIYIIDSDQKSVLPLLQLNQGERKGGEAK